MNHLWTIDTDPGTSAGLNVKVIDASPNHEFLLGAFQLDPVQEVIRIRLLCQSDVAKEGRKQG